ncbi:TetR/AcrR family transcriptional regulator [Gluconobacter wancherniae]|uniref:TetR/AcrR family transcriptional regulator n=1 Tax=Gluconobacter wancherniae TaxID=1307955 RepID=UPI001B8BD31A|nr:TetR/AcrR family transcriptional regulator [Gluconobacter wancherniae]MBS1063662.1 TetR/AcrR family transcriptional regulator [Gluconobacter wancherniae]
MARTGRPREFDRDKAIDAATTLFWAQGYEPTSLTQLKSCMGNISPASFYAAFGSKETLFREVVQHYLATYGQVMTPLWDENLTPRAAIEQTLRGSAHMQSARTHPCGCLVVSGANNCSPENEPVQVLLGRERERTRVGIRACVERAIVNGELRDCAATKVLPDVLATFFHGMTCEVKDGMTSTHLDAAITSLLNLWDANTIGSEVEKQENRR